MTSSSVVALVYNGLCTFEFGIAAEIFGRRQPALAANWYKFGICSADQGPLQATGGFTINVDHDLGHLSTADMILIPGWRDTNEIPPRGLLEAIRDSSERGARLVSVCTGVFVLAAAGVLDHRTATTHWRYLDQLASQYPDINVKPDVLYVDDGDVLTSAGSSAGIDLCLHIVRRDYGADVAAEVARALVVSPHREGGQAQFIPHPIQPENAAPKLGEVMDWVLSRIHQPLTVADMADAALMAPRTFARRFRAETGTTPHQWLTQQRLIVAQRWLETTPESIERVAQLSGFRTAETLRHHFRRAYQISPTSYRRRFSVS